MNKKSKEILEKAGWYEKRKIDITPLLKEYDIENLDEIYKNRITLEIFPKMKEFLETFGDIIIRKNTGYPYHIFDARELFSGEYNPGNSEEISIVLGEQVLLIGSISSHTEFVYLAESGKVYTDRGLLADDIYQMWEFILETGENNSKTWKALGLDQKMMDVELEVLKAYEEIEYKLKNIDLYRYDENNNPLTGWQYLSDNWYYLNENGEIQRGLQKVIPRDSTTSEEKSFYFNCYSGALVTNKIIDGYTIDENGMASYNKTTSAKTEDVPVLYKNLMKSLNFADELSLGKETIIDIPILNSVEFKVAINLCDNKLEFSDIIQVCYGNITNMPETFKDMPVPHGQACFDRLINFIEIGTLTINIDETNSISLLIDPIDYYAKTSKIISFTIFRTKDSKEWKHLLDVIRLSNNPSTNKDIMSNKLKIVIGISLVMLILEAKIIQEKRAKILFTDEELENLSIKLNDEDLETIKTYKDLLKLITVKKVQRPKSFIERLRDRFR